METFHGPTADTKHISILRFLFGKVYCPKCNTKMKLVSGWKDYYKCKKCGHMTFFEFRRNKNE